MNVAIEITPNGRHTRIEVGGRDISNAISAVEVKSAVGEFTRVQLTMPLIERASVDGSVRVCVSPATHEALIALGWTPPVVAA